LPPDVVNAAVAFIDHDGLSTHFITHLENCRFCPARNVDCQLDCSQFLQQRAGRLASRCFVKDR
jgi:hypothetical protein